MSTMWRKCSSCKKEISFGADYYQCSVSTCKHPRTGFQFCSVECWDAHLGFVFHRDAWAEEAKAPQQGSDDAARRAAPPAKLMSKIAEEERAPVRKIVEPRSLSSTSSSGSGSSGAGSGKLRAKDLDTLVVVSKVKQLIRDRSEFNTSQCCIDALTEAVAEICLRGIETARADGRKTVMGRDID